MNPAIYAASYGSGARKLGRYSSITLLNAHYINLLSRTRLDAIEQAFQTRIDEEGCGAFFAAVKFPQVDTKSVTHQHTLSVDTSDARHGDMNGDAAGDAVAQLSFDFQGVSSGAMDLGSVDFASKNVSTTEEAPLPEPLNRLK